MASWNNSFNSTQKSRTILKSFLKRAALFSLTALSASYAQAEGKLTVYCSAQNSTCEKVTQRFAQKYDVQTQFVRNSTGTVLGKIKAEKDNPQADVWYGGTFEPHFQGAEQGLFAAYRSPLQQQILPQFQKLTKQRGEFNSIIYLMEVGIGFNREKLAEKGIKAPRCFADLLDPAFKNQVQYADPRVSGTGYSLISTLVSLWGEDKAFDYLKKLNANIAQYTKSGLASANISTGEVAVDISYMHNYVKEREKGAPVDSVLPCEGVGYTLGAVSIIKGARNLDNAKKFVDWALSAEAQEIPWREADSYQLPTNANAQASPKMANQQHPKWVDIDFTRFGQDAEAKRLIERWVHEVKGE